MFSVMKIILMNIDIDISDIKFSDDDDSSTHNSNSETQERNMFSKANSKLNDLDPLIVEKMVSL